LAKVQLPCTIELGWLGTNSVFKKGIVKTSEKYMLAMQKNLNEALKHNSFII
jgi:hypothetical protein